MNDQKTPIIMFDGPDGVGKTTQLQCVREAAEAKGLRVYVSRMLGGTPFGEALREAIFQPYHRTAQSDLYVALATAHTLAADLHEKNTDYDLILIDRSPLSILAFQVAGSGLDEFIGKQASDEELRWLRPSLICLYEADQDTLLERLPTRSQAGKGDYFEDQDHDYHVRVADQYRKAARWHPDIVAVIDADGSLDAVTEETFKTIHKRLGIML